MIGDTCKAAEARAARSEDVDKRHPDTPHRPFSNYDETDCRFTSASPVREDALADKRRDDVRSDDREP